MARDDFYASAFGVFYSAQMEHPAVSRRVSRLVWGGDCEPYYESMVAVGGVPDGGTIVDCPCGAGPALRALQPGRPVRYVAVDLSPSMLRRARRRALDRGLRDVELFEADATQVPLASDCADLFLSYWGLHCFDDPAAAMVEAARVLKPGGRLVGACFVGGRDSLRQRLLIRSHKGDFGEVGTQPEIEGWIVAAGFELVSSSRSGPFLFFEAELHPVA